MRKGQNPAKFVNTVAKPAKITVAVLSYIPFLSGYYSESLNILKLCINSLYKETNYEFDVLVFDNGSCNEVTTYLLEEYKFKRIQFLILSEKNLGKGGAWNVIFNAAQGDYIVYLDSDVIFRDNWLTESMKIMSIFPNVGMVTARPFYSKKEYLTATLDWTNNKNDVIIEKGKLIPWNDFLDFNLSLGQNVDQIKQDYENIIFERITYKGLMAIAGASHWQFLTKKEIIQKFLPFDMDRPMGLVKQLDEKINHAGYLRLMLDRPYADNLSNTLTVPNLNVKKEKYKNKSKFSNQKIIKKALLFIYNKIFEIYYKS